MSTDTPLTAEKQTEPKPQHHGGRMAGWTVEARVRGERPVAAGDQIFDTQWRRVSFAKTMPPHGVPTPSLCRGILDECSLYGYDQAQALRWWLLASCEAGLFIYGLETRLVCHEITYSVEWRRKGEQDVVCGDRP